MALVQHAVPESFKYVLSDQICTSVGACDRLRGYILMPGLNRKRKRAKNSRTEQKCLYFPLIQFYLIPGPFGFCPLADAENMFASQVVKGRKTHSLAPWFLRKMNTKSKTKEPQRVQTEMVWTSTEEGWRKYQLGTVRREVVEEDQRTAPRSPNLRPLALFSFILSVLWSTRISNRLFAGFSLKGPDEREKKDVTALLTSVDY